MDNKIYDMPNEYINEDAILMHAQEISNNLYVANREDIPNYDDCIPLLQEIISVIRNEEGTIYIYNRAKNYYEVCQKEMLQLILKSIFKKINLQWSFKHETNLLSRFLRDSVLAVKSFNLANAVNLKNGIFNMDDGSFEAHSPENTLFTYCCDYKYEKGAGCTKFLEFINSTFQNDIELIKVIQEIMGYCLSINMDAQKIFFLLGAGANGKTVLVDVLSNLVGCDMVANSSLEELCSHFGRECLIDKKLNVSNECSVLPDTAIIKAITGGDKQGIPRKYKTDYSVKLICKIVCVLNELPATNDLSHGYFRRVIIIPFKEIVSPENMNKNLKNELLEELSGILMWAYEGYRRLVKNEFNFTNSGAIEQEIKKYIEVENPTGTFFVETYEKDPEGKILRSEIYKKDFAQWAEDNGSTLMTRTKFYRALKAKVDEGKLGPKWEESRINGKQYLMGYRRKLGGEGGDKK